MIIRFYFYLIILFFINLLNAGNDFLAIYLFNDNKQSTYLIDYLQNIQNYISNQAKNLNCHLTLAPKENLHITLKEISDLDDIERKMLIKSIKKLEEKVFEFNITESIKHGHISISGDRIRYILKKDKNLTNLAKKIENKLIKLKDKKIIKELKERMDFPLNGHITLGSIKFKKDYSIKEIEDLFNNFNKLYIFNSNFMVKNFNLLKSNRPEIKRVYSSKYKFRLKKLEKK